MSLAPKPRRRGTTWYLQIHEDGSCEVLKRGRPVLSGVPMSSAQQYLKNRRGRSDAVFVIEPDGVQRPLRASKG